MQSIQNVLETVKFPIKQKKNKVFILLKK